MQYFKDPKKRSFSAKIAEIFSSFDWEETQTQQSL